MKFLNSMKRSNSIRNYGVAATATLAIAAFVHSQPTKAQVKAMSVPRPAYNVTTSLDYVGDYGYYNLGSLTSMPTNADLSDPSRWKWVRYTNPANVRSIWAWAAIGDGACGHAHISWGLWGKYAYKIAGFNIVKWTWLGGATQSGDVGANGSCVWNVNNSMQQAFGENYGWGDNYLNVNANVIGASFKYTEFVLGSISVSHGSVSCPPTNYCSHPTYSILYSVQ
jgi:hypothetical protein